MAYPSLHPVRQIIPVHGHLHLRPVWSSLPVCHSRLLHFIQLVAFRLLNEAQQINTKEAHGEVGRRSFSRYLTFPKSSDVKHLGNMSSGGHVMCRVGPP